ncbi:hypothetical protein KIAC18_000255 [Sporomusa sphaeroides]|uniref:hypothetical protein n=1 Tax=Sporomusa sphaeroides TaxID=47679 RepID=UPI003DA0C5AC
MANLKAAKSHRLGYPKPKTVTGPAMPQPATLVDPVSYIRFWDKYNHGEPVDISKAKKMTKSDLKKADPHGIELMLAYGVTQKQIAVQYNTPYGSLTAILKSLGVNTKVESIVEQFALMDLPAEIDEEELTAGGPEEPPVESQPDILQEMLNVIDAVNSDQIPALEPTPEELPELIAQVAAHEQLEPDGIEFEARMLTNDTGIDEIITELMTDSNPVPAPVQSYNGIAWFYGAPKNVLTIDTEGRVFVPKPIRDQYEKIRIGLLEDALLIDKTDDTRGMKITENRVRCAELAHELNWRGVKLPAKYEMVYNSIAQFWSGQLITSFSKRS